MNRFTPEQEVWIKALESGAFKQTTGRLFKPSLDKYCCLGVACKIAGIDIVTGETILSVSAKDRFNLASSSGKVKNEFFEEAEKIVKAKYYGHLPMPEITLAQLNDAGAPFEYIAMLLREYPYWFFTNFNREYTS